MHGNAIYSYILPDSTPVPASNLPGLGTLLSQPRRVASAAMIIRQLRLKHNTALHRQWRRPRSRPKSTPGDSIYY
ncbi:hypothetical protein CMUS01_08655 [Colletotrichum musicola]|uniref:Uncharacterized protein n=1 Tax=Colletotrichum musicola TaxID=2175873 RepID=A0A8H6ND51_9PEZI|nr:hypothetical protein CMUS01_08655 [Colletotrichum musicola]